VKIYSPNRGFVETAFDRRTATGAFVGWLMTSRTAQDIYSWANFIGVVDLVHPESLHVTIAYDPDKRLESDVFGDRPLKIPIELGRHNRPTTRILGKVGSPGALVTTFDSDHLHARHRYYRDELGFKHSFPSYTPHVTLSYDASAQRPEVLQQLMRCPCGLPFAFAIERIAPANPS
jgi:hypothetical protein